MLLDIFRRRTTPPPPDDRLDVGDATIASAAGLTREQWLALTNLQRASYRWNYKPRAEKTPSS